jgi:hypothetical protein
LYRMFEVLNTPIQLQSFLESPCSSLAL